MIPSFSGASLRLLGTITGRTTLEEAQNCAGQKMELAGTLPTHAKAPPGAQRPVQLRQTYSRDAFRKRTKPKNRKRN